MELVRRVDFGKPVHRFGVARAGLGALFFLMLVCAAVGAEPGATMPLRIGVYQVAPYGGQGDGGLFVGASVDLWRRVAEHLNWQYQLMPVSQMSDVLSGLENGAYDVAIGAITITPERLARVDFSYPTHRSGVAAVVARRTAAASAFYDYGEAVGELGLLILVIVILLTMIGVLMWWFERAHLNKSGKSAIAVGTLITERPPQSGRVEARIGLRMMPTFPRPSLSFRTAGFPRYGWKAGM